MLAAALAAGWLLVGGRSASAHPTPGSVAFVDFTVDGAVIEQDVPIEELERALHQPLGEMDEPPAEVVSRYEALLRDYAGGRIRLSSTTGGEPWNVRMLDVTGHPSSDGPRALFRIVAKAPDAGANTSVHIHDEIVAGEVISHYVTVFVRSDWARGVEPHEPRLAGTIHAGRTDITVQRDGSFGRGLRSVVRLGMEHIASGTDHLMFLFALLLAAPVLARDGRWRGVRSRRETLLALARIVSAFTVGHSLTLALGAFGWNPLSPPFVESAIALSVLVTAVHAYRPIFPRREAVVAGAFGLVHGLAFASSLAGRDLGSAQTAWTLFGFNTGIELAQLGLLALVLPWLLMLASTPFYSRFRVAGAAACSTVASLWLLERTLNVPNPAAAPLAWLTAHPLWLLFALAGVAVLAHTRAARSRITA